MPKKKIQIAYGIFTVTQSLDVPLIEATLECGMSFRMAVFELPYTDRQLHAFDIRLSTHHPDMTAHERVQLSVIVRKLNDAKWISYAEEHLDELLYVPDNRLF